MTAATLLTIAALNATAAFVATFIAPRLELIGRALATEFDADESADYNAEVARAADECDADLDFAIWNTEVDA